MGCDYLFHGFHGVNPVFGRKTTMMSEINRQKHHDGSVIPQVSKAIAVYVYSVLALRTNPTISNNYFKYKETQTLYDGRQSAQSHMTISNLRAT